MYTCVSFLNALLVLYCWARIGVGVDRQAQPCMGDDVGGFKYSVE